MASGPSAVSRLIARGASLSGLERNRFFLGQEGEDFLNLSEISGLDALGDARTHVHLDVDLDGWIDIAIVNANAPMFQLFRNTIGDRDVPERFVAIRFVGANTAAEPSGDASARDGYGAKVRLTADDGFTIVREHRAGDGFAAQNSATMMIGLGARDCVRSLHVRWPSGRQQTIADVPAGHVVTIREGADDATIRPYGSPATGGKGERPRCAG